MRIHLTRIILFLPAISAAMAQPPPQGSNPYSVEKEIELGKRLAPETQKSLQAHPDARLQAIGDKLAAMAGGVFEYRFFLYATENPPAEPITLPGGPVFVAQRMPPADDAETAAMLAHAIAHIALRHYTRELTRRELMNSSSQSMPPNDTRIGPDIRQSMEISSAFLARSFTLQSEFEADQLAVKLLIDAGYDPEALVRWLQLLPVPKVNLALGDRPAPSARIAAVQRAIKAAQ
jgi:predicted Zn-dependent protease